MVLNWQLPLSETLCQSVPLPGQLGCGIGSHETNGGGPGREEARRQLVLCTVPMTLIDSFSLRSLCCPAVDK